MGRSARVSLLPLHRRFHAFEDHGVLERHEIVERSLLERIFTEEREHPPRAHRLAAGEGDLLPRQVAGLGDSRADPLDQLSFRVDGKPGRNDEVADGPKRSAELTVSACLIGRPFAEEYARIGDLVCVMDGIGDVLNEFLVSSRGRRAWVRQAYDFSFRFYRA